MDLMMCRFRHRRQKCFKKRFLRCKRPRSVPGLSPGRAGLYTVFLFVLWAGFICPGYAWSADYSIQAGSFKDPRNAASLVAQLREKGMDVFCRYNSVEGNGGWFRVYIGHFSVREDARSLLAQLSGEAGYAKPFVVELEEPTDPYFLHIGSHARRMEAEREVHNEWYLFEPFIMEKLVSGQRWFRIYVGPFADEKDARRAGEDLKGREMISYFKPVKLDEDLGGSENLSTRAEKNGETAKTGSPASSEAVRNAESLMAQGKPAAAYDLLAPLEADMAGNLNYDYLLAISALDSGDPARASLVFERILALDPNFAGARLDTARAYFALGNYDQAETEFEAVLKLDPPPTAKRMAEKCLTAIEKASSAERTTVSGYLEATLGYDDNVNNSTEDSRIYVPAFAVTMTLAPTNVETSDTYTSLSGGVSVNHPLQSDLSAYLNVDGRLRRNFEEDEFDTDDLRVGIGVNLGEGTDRVRLGLKGERFWLDRARYRNTVGLLADWRHLVNARHQLILFGHYYQNRYRDLEVNDAGQLLGGISWLHAPSAAGNCVVFLSAYGGGEEEKDDRADGGKVFGGFRLGGQINLIEPLSVFISAGGQYGDYDETNAAFLKTREDTQLDVTAGLRWQPKENWGIRPEITYIKNDSNIGIYEYERLVVSLTLRRDFH